MEKAEFKQKLAECTFDENDMNFIRGSILRSIRSNLGDGNPRGHKNLIIVMEELSELTKEISKELRGKGDVYALTEELADVLLGVMYVQEITHINDDILKRAMKVKMERLIEVMDKDGVYK